MEVVEHVADVGLSIAQMRRDGEAGRHHVRRHHQPHAEGLGLAIIGAEYVLRWLPRGTHQYDKLVRPDELEKALRRAGMAIIDRTGVVYNPLADRWQRSKDMDVNYMVMAEPAP